MGETKVELHNIDCLFSRKGQHESYFIKSLQKIQKHLDKDFEMRYCIHVTEEGT